MVTHVVGGELAIEANDGAADQGHGVFHTRGIQHLAGLKVVTAIQNHIRLLHQCVQQCCIGAHGHGIDVATWVQGQHGGAGRVHLGLTNAFSGVGDLPLQVGQVHCVVVHQGDGAHARGRQIQSRCTAQAASPQHQGVAVQELGLSFIAQFIQQNVARIAQQLGVIHALVFLGGSRAL